MFETIEAQLSALRGRHAELTGILSAPRPDNTEKTRTERQSMREELQAVEGAISQTERDLVAAEIAAPTALRAQWATIAEQDRAAVVEALATVGHRAWRAVLASGGLITFQDWLVELYPEIEGRILNGARDNSLLLSGPITDAPDLPESLALSTALSPERRATLRREIEQAGA